MTTAGVLQMRMWVYGGPALAVAAGVGCACLMAGLPRFRTALSLATAAVLLALSISHGARLVGRDGGPGPDWRLVARVFWHSIKNRLKNALPDCGRRIANHCSGDPNL